MMTIKINPELQLKKPNIITVLGIKFVPTPPEDECVATMPVNENTRQPFGFLSGGATLALAETLAGAASCSICPDDICVGVSVSGTHIKPMEEGETVTATAKLLKQAKALHLWEVTVTDSAGELVSKVTVINYVRPMK